MAPSFLGATAIGRYFTVVSFVPSTVFVAYTTFLIRSGAFGDDGIDMAKAFSGLGLGDAAVLGVVSLLVALALHPLQHTLTQGFEGYWGDTSAGRLLAIQHILRHRRRALRLKGDAGKWEHESRPPGATFDETGRPRPLAPYAAKAKATPTEITFHYLASESWRMFGSYPDTVEHIMPTRLGNVLRRYEILAGSRYDLDSISAVPRLLQVADPRDVAYVNNQRTQMEMALRTSALALVATLLTVVGMWRHDLWPLVSLVPYAIAYLSYRGAVVVAHEYGVALAVLVDLNRFTLYERMHLPHPDDIEDERTANRHLMAVLRLDNAFIKQRMSETAYLDYVQPAPAEPPRAAPATPTEESAEPGPS